VAYSIYQNLWVSVGGGTNTLGYSTDGFNWTGLGKTVFAPEGDGVVYNTQQNIWVSGGQSTGGNTLAYSANGFNWIGL